MRRYAIPIGIVLLGFAICAAGVYVGETDDAPGAALIGFLVLGAAVVIGAKKARRTT
jgi:hypothetical protein